MIFEKMENADGPDAIRTHDLRLVKATSFQLDHGPNAMSPTGRTIIFIR